VSVLDTLRAASPARRSEKMCVNGALQAEWDKTLAEFDDIDPDTSGSLAQPAVTEIVDRLDTLREQVAASEVTFTFEKMPWQERLALQADHPPRDGNVADRIRGFNAETYFPALIAGSCVSVTGVDGDEVTDVPADVWESLLGAPADDDKPAVAGSLNSGQVDRLVALANQVNSGQNAVPPSARSLLVSQDSGASLAQPSPGTSPLDASADGNPLGSASTSTTKKAPTKGASLAS
jgi:hypothetical protein